MTYDVIIQKVNMLNRGALLLSCNVSVVDWGITLREIKVFTKGGRKWLGMPSRSYKDEEGNTKYFEMIAFDDTAEKSRFEKDVLNAIKAYIDRDPDLEAEIDRTEDEEIPF